MSVRVRLAMAAGYPALARVALEALEHHASVAPDVFQRAALRLARGHCAVPLAWSAPTLAARPRAAPDL